MSNRCCCHVLADARVPNSYCYYWGCSRCRYVGGARVLPLLALLFRTFRVRNRDCTTAVRVLGRTGCAPCCFWGRSCYHLVLLLLLLFLDVVCVSDVIGEAAPVRFYAHEI